jgi:hypothetical protein
MQASILGLIDDTHPPAAEAVYKAVVRNILADVWNMPYPFP